MIDEENGINVVCFICGKTYRGVKYGDSRCPHCGQEHVYDNDVYRVELTERQRRLLLDFNIINKDWATVQESQWR